MPHEEHTLADEEDTLPNEEHTLTDEEDTLPNEEHTLTDEEDTLPKVSSSLGKVYRKQLMGWLLPSFMMATIKCDGGCHQKSEAIHLYS